MRDDARRFESWEHSVANRLGLTDHASDAVKIEQDLMQIVPQEDWAPKEAEMAAVFADLLRRAALKAA